MDAAKIGRERPAAQQHVTNVINNFIFVVPNLPTLGNEGTGASAGPKTPARENKGPGAGAR